jgi:hypothetical protein
MKINQYSEVMGIDIHEGWIAHNTLQNAAFIFGNESKNSKQNVSSTHTGLL